MSFSIVDLVNVFSGMVCCHLMARVVSWTLNEHTGKLEGFASHPYISCVIQKTFFRNTCTGIRF